MILFQINSFLPYIHLLPTLHNTTLNKQLIFLSKLYPELSFQVIKQINFSRQAECLTELYIKASICLTEHVDIKWKKQIEMANNKSFPFNQPQ